MPNFLSVRPASSLGRCASAWLVCACVAFSAACGDDDPAAESAGGAGANGSNRPDASVRDLPGEGLETTPDSDTDTRQRDPIGPQGLGESVDGIRNQLDPGYGYRPDAGGGRDAGDAGAADEADAG
jgi:hypothetical protein